MRWNCDRDWMWQSPLSASELAVRISQATANSTDHALSRARDFVGSVTETGFRLTPLIGRQSSFLPTVIGRWRPCDSGTLLRISLIPNTALLVCLIALFACLGILVSEPRFIRVLMITLGAAGLGGFCLLGSHLAGTRIVKRKLQALMEAAPATAFEGQWTESHRMSARSWLFPGTVVLMGTTLWGLIYVGAFALTTRPSADLAYVFWATQAIGVGWLFSATRSRPKLRLRWLLALFLVELGWTWCVGVDGYAGDGRPLLGWRWSISQARSLTTQSQTDPDAASPEVNLDVSPTDFAEFRGPRRDGVISGLHLASDWDQSRPLVEWMRPVGAGWSGFAVVGDYAVTQEQSGEEEAVTCYELATGRSCWEHRDRTRFWEMMGGEGPRATPTIYDGHVFTLGATGILNCLDGRNGAAIWSVNIVEQNNSPKCLFGMAGSPLLYRDLVIVAPGGPNAALVAYDRHTGARVWRAGDSAAAYASPQWATIGGREQILSFNADGLFAHDPHDGRIMWSHPWVTPPERNNVCQPVVWIDEQGRDTVFISSGYDKGCALLEVGRHGEKFGVRLRWQNKLLRAKFTSVVEREGFVYGLDNQILCCLDLRTGRRCWKGGRYGFGQLLLVSDQLLILTEDGEIVLCDATPVEHRETGRFPVLRGRTWNHPAISGERLLIRNDRLAACVRLGVLPNLGHEP